MADPTPTLDEIARWEALAAAATPMPWDDPMRGPLDRAFHDAIPRLCALARRALAPAPIPVNAIHAQCPSCAAVVDVEPAAGTAIVETAPAPAPDDLRSRLATAEADAAVLRRALGAAWDHHCAGVCLPDGHPSHPEYSHTAAADAVDAALSGPVVEALILERVHSAEG